MARGISSMKAAPNAAEYVRCGALLETGPEYSPAKLSVFGLRKRFKGKPRAESRGVFQPTALSARSACFSRSLSGTCGPNPFGSAVFLQTCLIPEFVNQFRASAFVSSSDRDL